MRAINVEVSLTFDIDWAPDYAILKCLDLIESASCKATFFATHHTTMNQEIVNRGHNLGIHPNFLPGSSHGSNVDEIIAECLSYAPNAWCMRTHSLVQSTPLLFEIFSKFPQLKLDVSLFMHRSPYAHKVDWSFDEVTFERLLYNWEDDAQFSSYKDNTITYLLQAHPELFKQFLEFDDWRGSQRFLNNNKIAAIMLSKETNK